MIQSSSLIDLHNPQLVRAFRQNQVMVNNLLQKQIKSSRSTSFQMIKPPPQPATSLLKQPVTGSVQLLGNPNGLTNKMTNLNLNSRVHNRPINQPTVKLPSENDRTVQCLKAINSSLDKELLSRQVGFTRYLINHQTELASLLGRQTGEPAANQPNQSGQTWNENELLNFVQCYHLKRLHNLRKKMEKAKREHHSKKSISSYVLVDENVKLNKKPKKGSLKASKDKSCKDKKSRKKLAEIDLDKVKIKIKKLKKAKVGSLLYSGYLN